MCKSCWSVQEGCPQSTNDISVTIQDDQVDNGLDEIPPETLDERVANLIKSRQEQDELLFPQTEEAKAKAQLKFNEFNNIRNEETQKQFKQMQEERGY